jgi:hypothetical protein
MSFVTPIAALIAAGITVPLLVAMYFLKLRRRQVEVSSTLLWRRAVQDLRVNSPFQRLRRSLLLLLQLLLLAALLFALARPAARGHAPNGARTIIILDQSASMNATDLAPTRLARAKELTLQLIDGQDLGTGGGMMVVAMAREARVMQPFTSDKDLLRAAVQGVEPTDHVGDLAPVLRLIDPYIAPAGSPAGGAKSAASGGSGGSGGGGAGPVTVYIFSDGQWARGEDLSLRGGDLRYVRIAGPDADVDNLAITLLTARRDALRPQRAQVNVTLANYAAQPTTTHITLSLDGRPRAVASVTVPPYHPAANATPGTPGTPGSLVVPFPVTLAQGALVEVAHDHTDQLAADDHAAMLLAPPSQVRVMLVTTGNGFLERALRSAMVRKLVIRTPAEYENEDPHHLRRGAGGSEDGFDLIVFDGFSPSHVPPVNSLYLGAAPPLPGVAKLGPGAGEPRVQELLNWDQHHPLMQHVEMKYLAMQTPGHLALPQSAAVLAIADAGPVIAECDDAGVRHVMTAFGILDTNWPMQVSFVTFICNAVQTLGTGATGAAQSYRTGEVAVVAAEDSARELIYQGPMALTAPVTRGWCTLPEFTRVGLYRCQNGAVPPGDQLPVNLCDAVASDLHAPAQLPIRVAGGTAIGPTALGRQEVWHWFMWAALSLLLLEWLVYAFRLHR